MISIVTPTHCNQVHFYDLWKSIQAQTYKKWEWVIYLNGNAQGSRLIREIEEDERVKVYNDDWKPTFQEPVQKDIRIGNIKNKAFSKAKGSILVEADHDDMLTPDCLKEVNIAFRDKKVGFVYSDTAFIGLKKPFDATLGWQSYTYDHNGEKLIVMCAFEPSWEKVTSMWFSPNHVRAWRKSVYTKLGGHDKTLKVCDDLDLIIRTYQATKMKRIAKPLYIYRITGHNTFIKLGYEIQKTTKQIQEKYAQNK